MDLDEFDYILPEELIAQRPLEKRDAARMLLLDKQSGAWEHKLFRDLPSFLSSKDILVFNNSRVVMARLEGFRDSGGKVECFVLGQKTGNIYECLLRSSAKKDDLIFHIADAADGKVLRPGDANGTFDVEFHWKNVDNMDALLERYGHVPLPPYIERPDDKDDTERYQTIHARVKGSVAAPTAGLHFSPQVMQALEAKGVRSFFVTLHVGLGTFQPIKAQNIFEHEMHQEHFSIPPETLRAIAEAKINGGRVIAVGTTTVRALESQARGFGGGEASGWTKLFLFPGEKFQVVDALFTNFHQPRSSLMVLVSAFAGKEKIRAAYIEAINKKYRFLSYGDCMFIR